LEGMLLTIIASTDRVWVHRHWAARTLNAHAEAGGHADTWLLKRQVLEWLMWKQAKPGI
jgi:hypothetical protein